MKLSARVGRFAGKRSLDVQSRDLAQFFKDFVRTRCNEIPNKMLQDSFAVDTTDKDRRKRERERDRDDGEVGNE